MPAAPADFYDDVNQQHLYALEKLYGVPDFAKSASIESKDELAQLPSTAFADPVRRKFPCHTKAATWLAQAYFSAARPTYSKQDSEFVQDRITKYAAYWNISGLVEGFKKAWDKIANFNPANLEDEDYALVVDYEGQKIRRMPMPSAPAVKMAGEYLYANRFKYPYQWRKTAARKILARALAYDDEAREKGIKVAEALQCRFEPDTLAYLERAAGFGMVLPVQAGEKIAQRVMMLTEQYNPVREKLAEIALEVAAQTDLDCEKLAEIAELIDNVDRETGLAAHYQSGVDLPEEMFFDVLQKEAAAFVDSHVQLTTGNTYPIEAFSHLPLAKVAEVMGQDFADAVAEGNQIDPVKFATVARTLPRPDASLLENVMQETAKAAMEKDARARRFDPNSWRLPSDRKEDVGYFQKLNHPQMVR